MKTPTLSIIVPVYNVEPYLRQALDSILEQDAHTLSLSLQIVLVDDGSTDGSGHICDEYARRDHRIQVIHQSNAGAASARNRGLDVAKGEYIAFLDGDDWLEPHALSTCVGYLDQNPDVDVVGFGIIEQFAHGQSVDCAPKELIRLDNEQILKTLSFGFSFVCGPTVWSKVFRRHVLEGVRFRTGKRYEDNTFMLEVMYPVQQYHVLPIGLINYRRGRVGSVSGVSAHMVDLFDNIEHAIAQRPDDKRWALYLNTMAVHYAWLYFYQTYRLPDVYKVFVKRAMPYVRRMRVRPYLRSEASRSFAVKLKLFLAFPRLYTRLSLGRKDAPKR